MKRVVFRQFMFECLSKVERQRLGSGRPGLLVAPETPKASTTPQDAMYIHPGSTQLCSQHVILILAALRAFLHHLLLQKAEPPASVSLYIMISEEGICFSYWKAAVCKSLPGPMSLTISKALKGTFNPIVCGRQLMGAALLPLHLPPGFPLKAAPGKSCPAQPWPALTAARPHSQKGLPGRRRPPCPALSVEPLCLAAAP